jgi:hypothetical protein
MEAGQKLTTRVWLGPAKGGRRMVAFEVTESGGKLAVKNGLAEVRA